MANTLLTPDQITVRAQAILHSKATFIGTINRQYDDSFANEGAKISDTLRIRLPNKYTVSTGAALSTQDTLEKSVTLPVQTQAHVDTTFTTAELTMDIDTFAERILDPGISQLAAYIDNDALNMYNSVGASVGTPGTTPATLLVYGNARTKLNQQATPKDNNRCVLIDSAASAATVDGLKGLFQSSTEISRQYLEGQMGKTQGFDFYESDLIQVHTTGAFAGTVLVDDASIAAGDTTIGMDAFTDAAPTVKKGDVFTIAGVFDVHPETKQAYSHLKQFVVTADATGATNQITSVAFSPALQSTGPYQNISALPADDAAVTFLGTASTNYPQNLAYHRDAFTFASADLVMPEDTHFKSRIVFENISMRLIRQYTIADDKIPARIDVLYGYKELHDTFREPQSCRIWG